MQKTAAVSVSPATLAEAAADTRPTNVRYWVLALFCLAATIAYVQRYSINNLVVPIQTSLRLNEQQMGWVMSGFFTLYAAMQLPASWLADRWGSRKALTLYAVIWSVATGLMAVAGSQMSLLVIWSVMGIAQAGLFPSAMLGVREWLPSTRRALASGMLSSCMSLGGALAQILTGALLYKALWTWRWVFVGFSVPGIAWALFYYLWFRDRPAQHRRVNAAELRIIAEAEPQMPPPAPPARSAVPWRVLAGSATMWLICGQQFFRAFAQVFFGTWFGKFLNQSPGLSEGQAAFLSSVPLFVLIVGAACGGLISDWLLELTGSRRASRQWLACVNMLLCALMFMFACVSQDSLVRVALISTACFFMAVGGVSGYTITLDMGGEHLATIFAIMNMVGSIGGAFFPLYVGWLVYHTRNWNYVLFSIALIYLGAAACWALLNPNGTIFDKHPRAAL